MKKRYRTLIYDKFGVLQTKLIKFFEEEKFERAVVFCEKKCEEKEDSSYNIQTIMEA